MKQQARIRLKTTSLLNIPSTETPLLFSGETPLQLQRVPSGNEMHLFILIPPQHFRCTINAQQATQWGMRGGQSHTDTIHACVAVCVCVTCVCGQVKGNRWSLFAHKGTKTINANDDDDVEQDNARSYLPPPCGSISLLLLLMTPRGGQRMNNKPPQTWNALKIHNFQIIFNDFKYTWVEPVAPRQMDHEQRPEA